MFICFGCAEKYEDIWSMARSYGPCEICHHTKECYDYHGPLGKKKRKA